MEDTSKTPIVRFKGFTEDWEQRKVGDFYDFKNGLNKGKEFFGSGTPIVNFTDVFHNRGIISRNLNGKVTLEPSEIKNYEVKKGDIFFTRTSETIEEIGYPSVMLDEPANTVFSGFVLRGRCILNEDPLDDLFKKYVFFTDSFRNEMLKKSSMTTRALTSGTAIKGMEFLYPSSKDEQHKIGEFITKLDNLITLHQRKYDKLVNVKKAMLEKMFPCDGALVPEIRFQGFTDDWEQRKVSDLLEERNEQAPESEDYPLMAFIANEGVAPKGERYDRGALVKDAANKNYKKTELGDFIYSSNNLETGSIGLNNYGKASISPVYSIFMPTGIADSDFIGRRFVRKDFINAMVKWRQGVVYGQWRIHESDFLKIEVAVPSLEEQRKIGAFLSGFDNLITLHQRKLDKLINIKKSMLEEMFV